MTDTDSSETGSPGPTNESGKRESMHTPVENRATARQSSTPETNHPTQGTQSLPTDANRLETNTGAARDTIPIIARRWNISVGLPSTLPRPARTRRMRLPTKRRRRSIRIATRLPRILIPRVPPVALLRPTILPTAVLSNVCTRVPALAKTIISSNHPLGITTLPMGPRRTTLPDSATAMTRAIKSINATCWVYRI